MIGAVTDDAPVVDARCRWIPPTMWVIAISHTLLALTDPVWRDVIDAGVIGKAVGDDPLAPKAFGNLYFLTTGVLFLALAHLTHTTLRRTGRVPAYLGWYLLVGGILVTTVEFPATGGWAVALVGAYVLYAARQARP